MAMFEVLPAELIAQVLLELDPSSFYVCLHTSRHFRAHALASTKLLRTQLNRIPGQPVVDYDNTGNADQLLSLFSKRAHQHLFNGTEQMADMHVWHASPDMERKTSCIVRWDEMERKETAILSYPPTSISWNPALLFLEAQPSQGTVNIYSVQESGLLLKHVISPQMVAHHLPGYSGECTNACTVVKVTADSRESGWWNTRAPQIAVLYAPKERPLGAINDWLAVICFHLDPTHGPMITNIYDTFSASYPMPFFPKAAVVDMALRTNGGPVILYKVLLENTIYTVVTHRNTHEDLTLTTKTDLEYQSFVQEPDIEEPVGSISLIGNTVHLCPTTMPIPYWTAIANMGPNDRGSVERRNTSFSEAVETFINQSLGRTLATYHHHRLEDKDLNDGDPTCVNTALELMIARDSGVRPYGGPTRQGIYLLKALHYPDSCEHFDKDTDYRFLHHVAVARLDGLPVDNICSIGIKLAVIPGAHRIAIAHWRTLLVYALDTRAFLDLEYTGARGGPVPGDYAYIEGCGWQFYKNAQIERDCVVLQPVRLECKGVVFGLEWRGEDELWGWTEQGVVRWRIGVDARGRRSSSALGDAVLDASTRRR